MDYGLGRETLSPSLLLNSISFLLAGPVFFIIDYTAGMPMWWTVADLKSCGFFGAALLWLNRGKTPLPSFLTPAKLL